MSIYQHFLPQSPEAMLNPPQGVERLQLAFSSALEIELLIESLEQAQKLLETQTVASVELLAEPITPKTYLESKKRRNLSAA